MEAQYVYQQALAFAAGKHAEINQLIPGTTLPYAVHISNVAMEILIAGAQTPGFNLAFAVQIALLHDTLEDTNTTFEELENIFGHDTASAVQALTKNDALDKADKMHDSLIRIKKLPHEVWAVKLADRITNLQPPPAHWSAEKIQKYKQEALVILETLGEANAYLANRLKIKIESYG